MHANINELLLEIVLAIKRIEATQANLIQVGQGLTKIVELANERISSLERRIDRLESPSRESAF